MASRYLCPGLRAPDKAQGLLWASQLLVPPSFAKDERDNRELNEGINSQTFCARIEVAFRVQEGTRKES